MSSFKSGQLDQLGNKLELAGWQAEDITNLGQASVERLTEIRLSLLKSDVISAIEVGKTELRLHPDQEKEWVQGRKILNYFREEGLLDGCADLDELKIVQAQGIDFFREHGFSGKAIVGWRGVQDDSVPFLVENGGKVVLHWYRLGSGFDAGDPALRRK